MKRISFLMLFFVLFAGAAFPGGFEFTLGGGFNDYNLKELNDNYKRLNNSFEEGTYVSYEKYDEKLFGETMFFEIHYPATTKFKIGIGYSHMFFENSAGTNFFDSVIGENIVRTYTDEIDYDLFYLSVKYYFFKTLYAGLRTGIGHAEFTDGYGQEDDEFDTTGFLLSPSVGAEINVWKYFNLGVEVGYRSLDMKDIEHYYPDQILWGDDGTFLDFDSSACFVNMYVVVKM